MRDVAAETKFTEDGEDRNKKTDETG